MCFGYQRVRFMVVHLHRARTAGKAALQLHVLPGRLRAYLGVAKPHVGSHQLSTTGAYTV